MGKGSMQKKWEVMVGGEATGCDSDRLKEESYLASTRY